MIFPSAEKNFKKNSWNFRGFLFKIGFFVQTLSIRKLYPLPPILKCFVLFLRQLTSMGCAALIIKFIKIAHLLWKLIQGLEEVLDHIFFHSLDTSSNETSYCISCVASYDAGYYLIRLETQKPFSQKGRVENRLTPALPHRSVHALLTHTAFRCSSHQGMRCFPASLCRNLV